MIRKTLQYARKIGALHGYRTALYFSVYAQAHRGRFAPWLDFVETMLPEGVPESLRIRLAYRPALRFMRPWLTLPERMDILSAHYAALEERLSQSGIAEFLNEQGGKLAEVTGKSGKQYTIRMKSEVSKEGAVKILLIDPAIASPLAQITGIIGPDRDGRTSFWIGAFKGPKPGDGKEAVSEATKDLNNLRPKQAVLHAACAVAEWFGAGRIIAPGMKNQIAIKRWYKKPKIQTEYDSFWAEFTDGAAEPDGDYYLSLPLRRRNLAEVQSKRRKDWIVRYQHIDNMSAEIGKSLDALAGHTATREQPLKTGSL